MESREAPRIVQTNCRVADTIPFPCGDGNAAQLHNSFLPKYIDFSIVQNVRLRNIPEAPQSTFVFTGGRLEIPYGQGGAFLRRENKNAPRVRAIRKKNRPHWLPSICGCFPLDVRLAVFLAFIPFDV